MKNKKVGGKRGMGNKRVGGSRFGAGEPPLCTFWRPAEALNTPQRRVPGNAVPPSPVPRPQFPPWGFLPLPSLAAASKQSHLSPAVTPHQSQKLSLKN